jgi:hypothetical protein
MFSLKSGKIENEVHRLPATIQIRGAYRCTKRKANREKIKPAKSYANKSYAMGFHQK